MAIAVIRTHTWSRSPYDRICVACVDCLRMPIAPILCVGSASFFAKQVLQQLPLLLSYVYVLASTGVLPSSQ